MKRLAKKKQHFIKNEPWTLSSIWAEGVTEEVGYTPRRGVANLDLILFAENIGQMRCLV